MTYQKKQLAGQRMEADVAYYLSLLRTKHPKVHFFHDLRFTNGEHSVQIDHLVLHPHGFILIESKSVYGEVKVNKQGEWSRSYKGEWIGIRSPAKQLDVQQAHLKKVLQENRRSILGKSLGVQKAFGGREWNNFIAISSSSIIHRDNSPNSIMKNVVKAEFVADAVNKILSRQRLLSTSPKFSDADIERLVGFLRQIDTTSSIVNANTQEFADDTKSQIKPDSLHADTKNPAAQIKVTVPNAESTNVIPACKSCKSNKLSPMPGRFGYYFKCLACSTNTPMPKRCPQCNSDNARTRKRKERYFVGCAECDTVTNLT